MITVIQDQLASSLRQGLLLGDLIYRATGDDLHVTRFPEDHLDSIADRVGHRLLHRTTASYAGLRLGSAETYWWGSREAWSALAGTRMKHLLHRWSYEVGRFSFDRTNWTVRRSLHSRPPGGRLMIFELLLLEPMLSLDWSATISPGSGKDDA